MLRILFFAFIASASTADEERDGDDEYGHGHGLQRLVQIGKIYGMNLIECACVWLTSPTLNNF